MSKIQYIAFADTKAIDAGISSIRAGTKAHALLIQSVTIAIFANAGKHGNRQETRINKLMEAVKGLGSAPALAKFVKKFGGYKVDLETGLFKEWKGKEHIVENFEEAKATMWNAEMDKAPAQVKDMDINDMIKAMFKRGSDNVKKGGGFNRTITPVSMQTLINGASFDAMTLNSDKITVEPFPASNDDASEAETTETATAQAQAAA